jgi:glycosyltransferase involved in cell wall biosynthesis
VGVLVEAARLLKPRLEARFALAGNPDPGNPNSVSESTLRAWNAEGIVEWWGWQDDIRQAYARAHIVTLPTMYGEGVPTSLLEAAACGRPLVATDTPGCRPVVIEGVTGLRVPPGDALALASALERLILDPALRGRMGAAGRELILSKYTTGQVNSATLRVYQKLLNP